jgi:hypothetical protein
MSWFFALARTVAGQLRNRFVGGLVAHLEGCRQAGERSRPALFVEGLWVENTTGENAYLRGFRVELSLPVSASTENVQVRTHQRPVVVHLPVNVPAWGSSGRFDAIAHFQTVYPLGAGRFQGRVAALGRRGFRLRWAPLSGTYEWRDE